MENFQLKQRPRDSKEASHLRYKKLQRCLLTQVGGTLGQATY